MSTENCVLILRFETVGEKLKYGLFIIEGVIISKFIGCIDVEAAIILFKF